MLERGGSRGEQGRGVNGRKGEERSDRNFTKKKKKKGVPCYSYKKETLLGREPVPVISRPMPEQSIGGWLASIIKIGG